MEAADFFFMKTHQIFITLQVVTHKDAASCLAITVRNSDPHCGAKALSSQIVKTFMEIPTLLAGATFLIFQLLIEV